MLLAAIMVAIVYSFVAAIYMKTRPKERAYRADVRFESSSIKQKSTYTCDSIQNGQLDQVVVSAQTSNVSSEPKNVEGAKNAESDECVKVQEEIEAKLRESTKGLEEDEGHDELKIEFVDSDYGSMEDIRIKGSIEGGSLVDTLIGLRHAMEDLKRTLKKD